MAKNPKIEEPVSMYEMFAKLFSHVSKEVVEKFGDEGKEAIKKGVWNFGYERGQNIAKRAEANGLPNIPENYLTSYDMERSELFASDDTYGKDKVEQVFTKCIFASQWMEDGDEEYGMLYCEMIDPSVAAGYNENMECIHEKHIFEDKVCTFCFKLKD